MKKIILLPTIFICFLFLTSCKVNHRVIYRDYNRSNTYFDLWFGSPYWGWDGWYLYRHRVIPRYYTHPNIPNPTPPSHYNRRREIRPQRRVVPKNDFGYPNSTPLSPKTQTNPNRRSSSTPRNTTPIQRSVSPNKNGRGN